MPKGWETTAAQKAEIVTMYRGGDSTYVIAERLRMDRGTVSKMLREQGVPVRGVPKLTAEQRDSTVPLYAEGLSTGQIAARFGVSAVSIRSALIRRGVLMRDVRARQIRCALRHDAFADLTSEALYWCGFIFTDGCVTGKPGLAATKISVEIIAGDYQHIVKLRAFLGSTHAIRSRPARVFRGPSNGKTYTGRPQCSLAVQSDEIAERLLSLGRYEGPLSPVLAASRDFWRGAVDGDGTVGLYRDRRRPSAPAYPFITLYGQRRLVDPYVAFLAANGFPGRGVYPISSLFQSPATGQPARQIIGLLYKDALVALDRKAETARMILGG